MPALQKAVESESQRGLALCKQGKFEQAIDCFRRALLDEPGCADTHNNLGVALMERGLHAEAVGCFDESLRLRPDHAPTHHNRGNALRKLGRHKEAVAAYERALELQPGSAEFCNSMGLALLGLGEHAKAADRFREALRAQPDFSEALNNLGIALAEQGSLEEAVAVYRQGIRRKPRSPETHNNLGVALAAQGEHEAAEKAYRQALRCKSDYPEAHNNLGNALRQQGRLDEAVAELQEALRLAPDYPEAHNNLAIVRLKQGLIDQAVAGYQKAIRLKPNYAEAHMNLALAWLSAGQFEQGWPKYEWRFRMKEHAVRSFEQPRWDGSPLPGKTILLQHEQGLGDTLQFIRYAALVKRLVGTVVFEAPGLLLPLLKRAAGIDHLVAQGSALPPFDVYCPLLSLPGLLGTTAGNVPGSVPYLEADPALVEKWAGRLAEVKGLKIGIAWQGSKRYKDDRQRSIPLEQFAPLAKLPGVKLVSLQKGLGSEQLVAVPDWNVLDLGNRLDEGTGAFMDTAAVMSHLDLVVVCDTALGHLAGALGVPVWLALPVASDWRWMLHREDSPWYPSTSLFRQQKWGDWPDVFARIADEVRKLSPGKVRQAVHLPNGGDAESLRRWGADLCTKGRWAEAIDVLRQAVKLEPNFAPAHNNLGVALVHVKKFEEAVTAYREALRLKPDYPEARQNLGEALQQQGKLAEAIGCYREALRLKPMPQTHNNLGVALLALGKHDEALGHCREAVRLAPDYTQARANLADVLEKMGRLDEAVEAHATVFEAQALTAEASLQRGREKLAQGKLAESVAALSRAARLKPGNPEAHTLLGETWGRLEKWSQAVACFEEARRLKPHEGEVVDQLGNALRRAGRLAESESCCREVLRLRPGAEGHNRLGIVLLEQGRPAEAEECFRRGLALDPNHPHLNNNLGVSLEQQRKIDEAVAAYQQAVRIQSEAAEAHRNLALAWLLSGDFEKGWPEYEWRWRCPSAAKRTFEQPRWDGGWLGGKTILLWSEQGLGDTIQFIRYARLIQRRGATIVVEAPKVLLPLLKRCSGIDQLVAQGSALPAFDVHAPLMSLPALFHTTPATVPDEVPYLSADFDLIERWGEEIAALPGFKIGIAWQGSPRYGGDRHRSIPLKQFAPLARLPGVKLVSLQKGHGSEQLADVPEWGVLDLGKHLDEGTGAFMDTAAVMQHLDLVVVCDTALGHLAGALGVPVWLALPVASDWPWMLHREDTPWYPTMRLFRQKKWDDWPDVFQRIAEAVSGLVPRALLKDLPQVEMSPGDLLDRIAVLEAECDRGKADQDALLELGMLQVARARALKEPAELQRLLDTLRAVAVRWWDTEEGLRRCEAQQDFGGRFTEFARSSRRLAQERMSLKRQTNELYGWPGQER